MLNTPGGQLNFVLFSCTEMGNNKNKRYFLESDKMDHMNFHFLVALFSNDTTFLQVHLGLWEKRETLRPIMNQYKEKCTDGTVMKVLVIGYVVCIWGGGKYTKAFSRPKNDHMDTIILKRFIWLSSKHQPIIAWKIQSFQMCVSNCQQGVFLQLTNHFQTGKCLHTPV